MQSSDSTKFQGDALDEQKWRSVSSAWKNELENRPVDSDLEKKQGDPLLEALPSVPTEEPIHTGKLARELPEYHQGEARSLKDLTAESPMDLQEKSLQDLAHDLADKARDGEKYLEDQLIAGETFVENSVAPVVSSLLSSAYSAVAAATSMAIEKGKDGLHYLGKEAYELSDTMAEKTDDAIVKAKEVLSEGAHIAAEKSSQTAEYLSQKTEEIIHSAADKAQKTIETLVDAQYGAPVEYGTQGTPLSAEGFQDLEKAIKTFERSASFHLEQAQAEAHQEAQPSEAAQTLRDLADASEEEKLAKERALDFMKRESEEAEELRQIQMRAISEEKKIQREKTFVRSISQDLTESLRASASAYEKKIELEGASSSELRPLLGEEPMSQVTV